MKKIKRLHRSRIIFFLSLFLASLLGNGLGFWFFQKPNPLPDDFAQTLNSRLESIEKSQRDLHYRNASIEQANKERERLQNALQYHQRMMDKSEAVPSPSPLEKLSTE